MLRARESIYVPWALTLIGLGAFMTALDQTVVVTALPSVMLDLKIPATDLDRASWIITAYLLGYTVAMPLIGRLADVYGYPRVYQASLLVFILGSAMVALSGSLGWVVASRVIQAVGGGAAIPIGMALASTLLPPERRGLALGIVGGAAEAGSMLGPVYGGAIVELANWRWIFWLNLPQAALLLVALLWLPNQRNREARVDYAGGALLVAALLVLSLGLSRQGLFTLSSPTPFLVGAAGVLLVLTLVRLESRVLQPLLSPVLFRSWAFLAATGTQLLVGTALIIAMVTVPLMANTVMGKEPFTGALWLLRMTIFIPPGAVLGGVLMHWAGIRAVTITGLLLCAAGLFLVSTWPIGVEDPELTWHLGMVGLGFGLVIAPIMARALEPAGNDYRGTAASLVVVARMMGMTLGLAALSAWGVEHFQGLTAGLETLVLLEAYTTAGLTLFHDFLRVAGALSLLAVAPALLMRQDREPQQAD